MNFQLDNAVEYIDGENKGTLGEIMIRYVYASRRELDYVSNAGFRCNNVLWITEDNETTADAEMTTA